MKALKVFRAIIIAKCCPLVTALGQFLFTEVTPPVAVQNGLSDRRRKCTLALCQISREVDGVSVFHLSPLFFGGRVPNHHTTAVVAKYSNVPTICAVSA